MAKNICLALVPTDLDSAIDYSFERDEIEARSKKRRQVRMSGKETRKEMTDSLKEYNETTPGLSENDKKFSYAIVTNIIYKGIFGKTAEKLRLERGADKNNLRDKMDEEELEILKLVEERTAHMIKNGMKPTKAAYEALDYYNWKIVKYRESRLAR
jgi:hypothetical protein